MERAPLDNQEDLDQPEKKADDIKTSKKKRKTTKIPLKKTVKTESQKATSEPEKEEKPKVGLFLPEVEKVEKQEEVKESEEAEKEPQSEFAGELIIDHTDEELPSPEDSSETGVETEDEDVDVFEALLDASEVENAKKVAEKLGIVMRSEVEEEDMPEPPKVAPPLPFFVSEAPVAETTTPLAGESVAAEADSDIRPSVTLAPGVENSPLRGRLAEEWAAVRRRNAEFSEPEPAPTEEEISSRVKRAEKRALSQGVLSGGVFGYMLGRRGRKAAENKVKEVTTSHEKATRELNERLLESRRETEKKQGIIQRTEDQVKQLLKQNWENRVLQKQPEAVVEAAVAPAPVHEVRRAPERVVEKTAAPQEKQPENQPVTEKTYEAPKGVKVETSAWHRIEIDEKTGKVIENPKVEYGEAFKKEQSQEKLAKLAAKAQTAAQLGMTLISSGTQQTSKPMVPDEISKKGISTIRQDDGIPVDTDYLKQKVADNVTNPATWAVAFVILLILVLSGVLS